jgi:hypothetical protein
VVFGCTTRFVLFQCKNRFMCVQKLYYSSFDIRILLLFFFFFFSVLIKEVFFFFFFYIST